MLKNELLERYKQTNNFRETLGMELGLIEKGSATYNLTVRKKHLATPIAAHGGVVAALVDATMGVTALSVVVESDRVVSTVELKVSYLKPVLEGDQLKCIGEVLNIGNRLIYVECSIINQKEQLVARANGTFNAYPASKAF
jgi:acyl-CoA thioesterase